MIDGEVQMMDAGMALFFSEKPFGIVLGGIKAELEKEGKVCRTGNQRLQLPATAGECDLFLDWSTPLRRRYIACRLEYAGPGRYAARFTEGNRNTPLRIALSLACALTILAAGIFCASGPMALLLPLSAVLSGGLLFLCLKPSTRATRKVERLKGIPGEAK